MFGIIMSLSFKTASRKKKGRDNGRSNNNPRASTGEPSYGRERERKSGVEGYDTEETRTPGGLTKEI